MFFYIDFFPCGQFHRACLSIRACQPVAYGYSNQKQVFSHVRNVFTCLDLLKFVDRWRRKRRFIRAMLCDHFRVPEELFKLVQSYVTHRTTNLTTPERPNWS